jgi:hypothetical protein
MVPKTYPAPVTPFTQLGATPLHNVTIDNTITGYTVNSSLDFFLQLNGLGLNADLYVGRLDTSPGVIPQEWYYKVRPFSFGIHGITRQRNNATILNNVINPTKGERVYLDYTLNSGGPVTIQVFTLDGTLVQVLERGNKTPGNYRASWDGRNRGGRPVARGMYFIRIVAPDIDEIRKVMVIK